MQSEYPVDQLEKFQDTFESMRKAFHKLGDHDGQRLTEFALEMIRRYQMGSLVAPEVAAWISVEDRIPPALQDVLFWEPRGIGLGWKTDNDPDSRQWIDKLSVDRDGAYCDTYEVTHWMPLPASPLPQERT